MNKGITKEEQIAYQRLMSKVYGMIFLPYFLFALLMIDAMYLGRQTPAICIYMPFLSLLPCSIYGIKFTNRADLYMPTNNTSTAKEICRAVAMLFAGLGCIVGAISTIFIVLALIIGV